MKKTMLSWTITLLCAIWSFNAAAADLLQVFKDAWLHDPTFQAAKAEFHAVKEGVPIDVANFLPQLNAGGTLERIRNDHEAGANEFISENVFYNNRAAYEITLDQAIFNFANWASLANATALAKQQGAALCAAYQDLMIRTSAAYFNVLKASEELRLNIAEKKSIERQLEQNRERYKVGLIAITPVYETQASYDTSVAQEIASQNEFASRLEQLREITGIRYSALMGVKGEIPLNPPKPANMNRWVGVSEKQNYTLEAARYAVQAAHANIRLAFSGHLPVVNGFAGFSYDFQDNPLGRNDASFNKQWRIGVNASLPVFHGGRVMATTHQANFAYQQTSADLERVHRGVVSTTIQSYLGVVAGSSRIRADRQTIASRENALKATEAAYEVGTRVMVDVLNAQTRMFLAQQIYARDQYDFLLNNLVLEESAGTLCPKNLAITNRLLTLRVKMIDYKTIGKVELLGGPRPEHIKPIDLSAKSAHQST